ncbi:MAG: DMT family transporter [Muribaculaceae bacterium]|nr:DMT family transporter [Muribaculaceae bacterium]
MNTTKLKGHSAMAGAELMWGLGAPVGKMILGGGISSLILTDCRMIGAAILFWIISCFIPAEKIESGDMLRMFFASMLGIVINQCCFLWGLSMTSPINASIITTSMPIITMILAAVILHEPITKLKAGGVFLGAIGALILVMASHSGDSTGSVAGDIMIIIAQISFACYLVLFKNLIAKYSAITLMKWMFTYASICVIPFSYRDWMLSDLSALSPAVMWGVAFFVAGPTFISYLLLPLGQRNLRPTVTAMYNYVQPIVASAAAVAVGMDQLTPANAIAVMLVFAGVFMVTKSKSLADIQKSDCQS